MEKPNYYAVIPASVRYCKDLPAGAKLLFGEITSLTNDRGYCWASNSYFANLYGVSTKAVSRWIGELNDLGFIGVDVKTDRGNQRRITIDKNVHTYGQKSPDPMDKIVQHNNKSNTKQNNTAFLEDLISRVNPREKPTEARQRLLNARLKEYSQEEILKAAVAFSKSDWHKENGQMTIDNLLAPSKFGRWYTAGLNEKVVTKEDQEARRRREAEEDEEMRKFRES